MEPVGVPVTVWSCNVAMLVVFEGMSTRSGAVVDDDIPFEFRLWLFSLAAELGNVRPACRLMDVQWSTYHRCREPVLRSGLKMTMRQGRLPRTLAFYRGTRRRVDHRGLRRLPNDT